MVPSILPKKGTENWTLLLKVELFLILFWENRGDHKLLSRFTDLYHVSKPSRNKRGQSFLSAPKQVSFLQLAAKKKTPYLVQLENILALLNL